MNLAKLKNKVQLLLLLMTATCSLQVVAQEINAKVEIDHRSIQGTNVSVFETLESSLNDFVNNKRWTNESYEPNERIECNFFLNIISVTGTTFTGSLTVTARRPIYNSSINTTLVNLVDNDFSFTYNEFDQLVFNKNSLSQDLTAVIGFYVYTIIGLDADSFQKKGGDTYFSTAMSIVNSAQSSPDLNEAGWDRLGSSKNRHMLISQLISSEFSPLRIYSYNYHRLGLDVMADDAEKGADVIISELSTLERVATNSPSSYAMLLFFDSKTSEIQSILKEMKRDDQKEDKDAAIATLKKVDVSRVQTYSKLLK